MRREGRTQHLPLKIIAARCLQGFGVYRIRRPVLLGCEQHASPEEDVRIRGRANHPLDGLIIRVRIAIPAKERFARFTLGLVPIRVNVPLLEVGGSVRDADCSDVPIAVEIDVGLEDGREAVVRLDAKEGSFDVGGDLTGHLKVLDITLDARGSVEAVEYFGGGEFELRTGLLAVRVVRGGGEGFGEFEDVRHIFVSPTGMEVIE